MAHPVLLFFLVTAAVAGGWAVFTTFRSASDVPDPPAVATPPLTSPVYLTQAQIREMVREQDLVNAARNVFLTDTPNGSYRW